MITDADYRRYAAIVSGHTIPDLTVRIIYATPDESHPVVRWLRARYAAWLRSHHDYAPAVRK